MNLCNNCGSALEPSLRFCTDCGAPVAHRPEPDLQHQSAPRPENRHVAEPSLTALDYSPAGTEIAEARRRRIPGLPLLLAGVGVPVIGAAVLLLVLKPFSNNTPTIEAIEASQQTVPAGANVTLRARASDRDDDKLRYGWVASAGQAIGEGSSITLSTAGVDPGSGRADIRVQVTVDDGRGGTASADKTISVTPATTDNANENPTPALSVNVETDQQSIHAGETVNLTANVLNRDPSEVAYEWRTSSGTIQANGRAATLNTSSVQPGGGSRVINVTVTVRDGRGAIASNTAAINLVTVVPSNWPPVISLNANRTSVQQGDNVEVFANASDRDGDPLTYSWNVVGGHLVGGGNRVTLRTAASDPGNVEVSATVSDQRGESATGRVTIAVLPRPNRSPVISSIEPDRTSVRAGERVSLSVRAMDPDNDELSYSWTSSAGTIRGGGATATLDTSGMDPGSGLTQLTVRVTVSDQRGGVATESTSLTVAAQRRAETPRRSAPLAGYQARDGDDLIVTLTGAPGVTDALNGVIDVTAGNGVVQVSGVWPSGACRVNAGSQQNVDKISIVQSPLHSNGYSQVIVRIRPRNSKQPVRFTVSWRAI